MFITRCSSIGGGGFISTVLKRKENSRLDPMCRNFHGRPAGHIIVATLVSHILRVGNR